MRKKIEDPSKPHKNWVHAAQSGLPIKMTVRVALDLTQLKEIGLDDLVVAKNWIFAHQIKSKITDIVYKELNEFVGERKVAWRTLANRPENNEVDYLTIFMADDDWMVTAKLNGAIVASLPRTFEKLEIQNDQ
jgi:beta-xylosidase